MMAAGLPSPELPPSSPGSPLRPSKKAHSLFDSFAPELEPRSRVVGPRVVFVLFL